MCYFCNKDNIKDYRLYYDTWVDNKYDSCDLRENVCIVYDRDRDEYHLWIECGDPFFSGTVLEVNYCPVCGSKLKNE